MAWDQSDEGSWTCDQGTIHLVQHTEVKRDDTLTIKTFLFSGPVIIVEIRHSAKFWR